VCDEIHNGIFMLGISTAMYGTNVHPNNALTGHNPSMLVPMHGADNYSSHAAGLRALYVHQRS